MRKSALKSGMIPQKSEWLASLSFMRQKLMFDRKKTYDNHFGGL